MGSWKSVAGLVLLVSIALAWFNVWYKRPIFNPNTLANKVICICGASSGIGEEMAYQYSRHGSRLILAARRKEKLEKVMEHCLRLGSPEVHIVVADFAKPVDTFKVYKETRNFYGRIDVLILNHASPYFGFWMERNFTHNQVHDIFEINAGSFMKLATLFTPSLIESGGNIGVVSSMAGVMGVAQAALYSASKHALHGFFDAYRVEMRMKHIENVSVTMCVLGPVGTEMFLAALPPNSTDAYGLPISKVDDAVRSIIENVSLGERMIYFPFYIRYLHYLQNLLPDLVDDQTLKAYRNQPHHQQG